MAVRRWADNEKYLYQAMSKRCPMLIKSIQLFLLSKRPFAMPHKNKAPHSTLFTRSLILLFRNAIESVISRYSDFPKKPLQKASKRSRYRYEPIALRNGNRAVHPLILTLCLISFTVARTRVTPCDTICGGRKHSAI